MYRNDKTGGVKVGEEMEVWRMESNQTRKLALSVGCLAVGVLAIYLSLRYSGPNLVNARAGLGLGLILAAIGLYSFLEGGKQSVTVDPNYRQISVVTTSRLKTKRQIITFDEIDDITIGYIGKKSNFVNFYYLILKLKNGKECTMFSPGYYDHGSDRASVEGWRERLWKYIEN